jgi:pimeloyl-ACP methyl ester carboxylesterase
MTSTHERSARWRKVLRIVGRTVVVLLAALGLLWLVLPSSPGVGRFDSTQDRAAYVEAYNAAMATVPSPNRTLDVPTSYGTARAYEWNPGLTAGDPRFDRPVILLPGISSGAPMWGENLPDFADDRRVIVFDAVGDAGLSQQTVPIRSMADQAGWVAEAIGHLAPGQAHIVGHSFGGATAIAYAQAHPNRVASLTLLEPAFALAYPPASTFFWATVMILPVPQSWREHATMRIAGEEGPIDYADPVARMIDRAAAGYTSELPTPTPLDDAERGALHMPVYVAIADSHSLAGGATAAERAETFPDARVKVWPDTTHSLPMQAAEPLAAELKVFWAEHDR